MKGAVNISAYKAILENCGLLRLWEHYGEGISMFRHNCSAEQKASSIRIWFDEFGMQESSGLHRPTSTLLNSTGVN